MNKKAIIIAIVILSFMLVAGVPCMAGEKPKITVNPMSVNLGSVEIGDTSAPRTVKIKNKGSADLTISSIAIAGVNQSEFAQTNNCSSVPAKSFCLITVTFSPVSPTGKKKATMSISSNDPKKPTVNVKLLGKGTSGGGPSACNYFPHSLGDSWTINTLSEGSIVLTGTDEITDASGNDFTMTSTSDNVAGSILSYLTISNGMVGTTELDSTFSGGGSSTTTFDPPLSFHPVCLTTSTSVSGTSTETSTTVVGGTTVTCTGQVQTSFEVIGQESVTVPAGTFDAFKAEGKQSGSLSCSVGGSHPVSSDTYFWVVNGVGTVRTESADGKTVTELVNYTIK